MSDQYLVLAGVVQQFGDNPAVTEKEVSGQQVREFTVKTVGSQKLVRVTLWPEFSHVQVKRGDAVIADGKYTASEGKNGQVFHNLSASAISVIAGEQKQEREVVNRKPAEASGGGSPF